MTEIGSYFRNTRTVIMTLTVQDILNKGLSKLGHILR